MVVGLPSTDVNMISFIAGGICRLFFGANSTCIGKVLSHFIESKYLIIIRSVVLKKYVNISARFTVVQFFAMLFPFFLPFLFMTHRDKITHSKRDLQRFKYIEDCMHSDLTGL